MSRTRRIAATVAIVATATLGAAGVANASESHHGHDRGYDGRYDHTQYTYNHGGDYDRYNGYDRYNRYDRDRGLVGEVLHLVNNLL